MRTDLNSRNPSFIGPKNLHATNKIKSKSRLGNHFLQTSSEKSQAACERGRRHVTSHCIMWGVPLSSASQPATLHLSSSMPQEGQHCNIAADSPALPSPNPQRWKNHHATSINRRAEQARTSSGGAGVAQRAQRTTPGLSLSRLILPLDHLTILQVDVFRVYRHGPASSVTSACAVETIDLGPGLQVITTPW
jgi:hypothetical protein